MIAPSLRQLHRKHLRSGSSSGEQGCDEEPRSLFGCGVDPRVLDPPDSLDDSASLLRALDDPESELSRFLLRDDGEGAGAATPRRTGTIAPLIYALALDDPPAMRNERAIMIFEGYAIFGALFVSVAWIVYEWGNSRGGDPSTVANDGIDRAFDCVMAASICSNASLAMYGAFAWMQACMVESSHEDYVFVSRKMIAFLHHLHILTAWLVQVGILLGIWKNLGPNRPEAIAVLTLAILLKFVAEAYFGRQLQASMPLEFWHFPRWLQAMVGPQRRGERDGLEARAKLRAGKLRTMARRARRQLDPKRRRRGSVGALLRAAAVNLGKEDLDVSVYVARLGEDLFDEAHHLRGRSIECLSRYMPLRLAEQVQTLVETHECEF